MVFKVEGRYTVCNAEQLKNAHDANFSTPFIVTSVSDEHCANASYPTDLILAGSTTDVISFL